MTGWIPERLPLKGESSQGQNVFKMLIEQLARGHVLPTLATSEMNDDLCDRTGLVSSHAYALISVRYVEGKYFLLIKNPWSHLRWKGKYSERDTLSWTPSLKAALNYDPQNAKNFDDGVFWMDGYSVCNFFEVLYLNWNPSMFKYTYCTHA